MLADKAVNTTASVAYEWARAVMQVLLANRPKHPQGEKRDGLTDRGTDRRTKVLIE